MGWETCYHYLITAWNWTTGRLLIWKHHPPTPQITTTTLQEYTLGDNGLSYQYYMDWTRLTFFSIRPVHWNLYCYSWGCSFAASGDTLCHLKWLLLMWKCVVHTFETTGQGFTPNGRLGYRQLVGWWLPSHVVMLSVCWCVPVPFALSIFSISFGKCLFLLFRRISAFFYYTASSGLYYRVLCYCSSHLRRWRWWQLRWFNELWMLCMSVVGGLHPSSLPFGRGVHYHIN